MKKAIFRFSVVTVFSVFCMPVAPTHATPSSILISEIQTGSSASASEEFIELYNISNQTIDLSQYTIEYYSSSASQLSPLGSPTQSMHLSGLLYPGGYFLACSSGYLTEKSNMSFSATLADTGGAVRLLKGTSTTEDLVGWGSAKIFEGVAHAKPGNGKSLARGFVDNIMIDTDNNANDFVLLSLPTPINDNIAPPAMPEDTSINTPPEQGASSDSDASSAEPTPSESVTPDPPTVDSPSLESKSLEPIIITELLPNPASPATDADDEYIELYNSNDQDVSLAGYRIETGNSFSYRYTFGADIIPAHGYYVLYSKKSKLVLSNTSGVAQLKNPSGEIVSQTDHYEGADDGSAWALLNGVWQWTITPTPGTANILQLPIVPPVKIATAIPKPKASTKSTTTKPKTTSVKTASASKSASTKSSKAKAVADGASLKDVQETPSIHRSVLVGVGILALLYAGYEYRGDVRSIVLRYKRYRNIRRETS